VLSRGHLRCAISTSGVAPALASRLRQDLEQIFDDTFQSFLDWLASIRESVQGSEADAERRRTLLRDAVSGFKLTGKIDYPKAWPEERTKAKS
jgi:precorrin-2 dehydrogenase/sirohydrochlorin ferrochelatase